VKNFPLVLIFNFLIFSSGFGKIVYVDIDATGAKNGKSWQNAFVDLRQGLSASSSGDQIWVAEGTYVPGTKSSDSYALRSGVEIYGGFKGTETKRTERNWLTNKTTLSGDIGVKGDKLDNISQILQADGISGPVILDGFIISDGYSTGFTAGGMVIENCSPSIKNCVFENNQANGGFSSGGAVTITGFDGPGSPEFINCIFRLNSSSVIGGAVHSNNDDNRPFFKGCLFEKNTAVRGAAIHNGGGIVTSINCTFVGNSAEKGAASYTASGNVTSYINCIVWDNTSTVSTSDIANIGSKAISMATYSIVEGGFTGTGNLAGNPQFVSASDFNIKSTSPAKNSADPNSATYKLPALDLNGTNRVTFKKLDRGAYEYRCTAADATKETINVTTCSEYTAPSGKLITEPGTHTDVIPNYNGCDSVITINVTINATSASIKVTECLSYTLNNQTYTKSGVYVQTLTNSKGCDSLLTLDLTINEVDATIGHLGNTLTAQAQEATYQWIDCGTGELLGDTSRTFTATKDGSYAVIVTQNGCSDTSTCIELTPSGLINQAALLWAIYPNPAASIVTVVGGDITKVEILDVRGTRIAMATIIGNDRFSVEGLAQGYYWVRINDALIMPLVKE